MLDLGLQLGNVTFELAVFVEELLVGRFGHPDTLVAARLRRTSDGMVIGKPARGLLGKHLDVRGRQWQDNGHGGGMDRLPH